MRALILTALLLPQIAGAEIFMCVDPDTGKKTFTDKACTEHMPGTEVLVKPNNFGGNGHRGHKQRQTWNSDKKTGVSGPDKSTGYQRSIEKARITDGDTQPSSS
jgi:hypothetical protein